MKDLTKELDYFNRTYDFLGCRKTAYIKVFMYKLLECSSVENLKDYYYNNSKKFNLEYKNLERDLNLPLALEELKYRIVNCSINKLHSFQIF